MSTRIINLTNELMILKDYDAYYGVSGGVKYELRVDRDKFVSSDKFTKKVMNHRKIIKIHILKIGDEKPALVLDHDDFDNNEAIVLTIDENGAVSPRVVERKDKGCVTKFWSNLTRGDREKREALIADAKPMNPRTSS